jgi:hypothetical protein
MRYQNQVERDIHGKLMELIGKGASGWPRALVVLETAVSSAELNAEKALMRT